MNYGSIPFTVSYLELPAGPRFPENATLRLTMKPKHLGSIPALLDDIDHGTTSSHRAHLSVIMGYGKPDITVPSQWPTFHQQIEDKFSPYAKETLAKLITFLEVRDAFVDAILIPTHTVSLRYKGGGQARGETGQGPVA
jgi:hypothetical protein